MSLTDIGVTIALLAAVPAIFLYPFTGIVGWYTIAYLNPHRFGYGFAYGLPLGLVFGAGTILVWLLSNERKVPPITPSVVLVALFTLHFSMTTVFALVPDGAYYEWDRTVKITVMSLIAAAMLTSRERLHAMIWILVLGIGFHGLKGGLFTLLTGGGYMVVGPPQSFFSDRNFLAVQLATVIPLMRYLQMQTADKRIRLGLTVMMTLSAFAVLGTQSRAGFLTLAVLGAYIVMKSRHRIQLGIAAILLAVATLSFMPQDWMDRMETIQNPMEDRSFEGRITSWIAAVEIATARPVRGAGFEGYRSGEVSTNRAWHSIWFQVLGEQGWVGFLLWLGVGIATWMQLGVVRRRARGRPEHTWAGDMAAMIQVSLAAFAVGGSALDLAYVDLIYHLAIMSSALFALSRTWSEPAEAGDSGGGIRTMGTAGPRGSTDPAAQPAQAAGRSAPRPRQAFAKASKRSNEGSQS